MRTDLRHDDALSASMRCIFAAWAIQMARSEENLRDPSRPERLNPRQQRPNVDYIRPRPSRPEVSIYSCRRRRHPAPCGRRSSTFIRERRQASRDALPSRACRDAARLHRRRRHHRGSQGLAVSDRYSAGSLIIVRCRSTAGTRSSATRRWPTPSWIASCTTRIASNSRATACASSALPDENPTAMRYSNGEQSHAERPQTLWRAGIE
jgi:hypothetical protein